MLTSSNIDTDPELVLCKMNLKVTIQKPIPYFIKKLNIENKTGATK